MLSLRHLTLTGAFVFAFATAVLAQPPGRGISNDSQKFAAQRQARAAQAARAEEKQRDVQRLEQLISDLQAGKKVDPAELDRVLHDATR